MGGLNGVIAREDVERNECTIIRTFSTRSEYVSGRQDWMINWHDSHYTHRNHYRRYFLHPRGAGYKYPPGLSLRGKVCIPEDIFCLNNGCFVLQCF